MCDVFEMLSLEYVNRIEEGYAGIHWAVCVIHLLLAPVIDFVMRLGY